MRCRSGSTIVAFQIWVIVAAKLNCSVQALIVVVPVLVIVMPAWKPVLQEETSEYATVVLVVGGARIVTLAVPEMRAARGLHGGRSGRVGAV